MKKYLSIVLAILMLISLSACGGEASGEDNNSSTNSSVENSEGLDEEKVLVMDSDDLGYPSVYTVSAKGRGYLLVSYIFDTLMWKDENGMIPLVAKEYTVSEDNKVWTFKLNEGVKFTDGEELTADDVKFSFEYMMKHPHQWVNLNVVEKVEALSDYEVEVTLKEVYAPFLSDIAGNVPIMPKHIWENVEEPEKFNTEEAVIGSGPLMLKEYYVDQGNYEFIANKDYFLGEPVIDKLVMKKVSNSMESLKSGEINVASSMSYGEAKKLKEEGNFNVIEGPGLWVMRTYFNFDIPAFKEKDFRQAMYYAINRDEIVEKAMKNGALAGNPGHIHPDSEWYSKNVKEYEFSPEKAMEILDSKGMKDTDNDGIREFNGEKLSFELIGAEDTVNLCEMLKKYLSDIGIEVSVKTMDSKAVGTAIKEGNFQIAVNGHGSFGGDPVLLARFLTPGTNIGSTPTSTTQGGGQWGNPEFDEIFVSQLKELDNEKRYEQVEQLQNIISEELPTLTLYYKKIASAYDTNVFDGWFFTKEGVAISVPTIQNKLVFVNGQWKE